MATNVQLSNWKKSSIIITVNMIYSFFLQRFDPLYLVKQEIIVCLFNHLFSSAN